jgi:hypothetical protein
MQHPRPRRIPQVWIEHDLLDRYGQELGPRGIAVYVALARFANEPDAPPIFEAVGQITGLGPTAIMETLERIERLGLIERETGVDAETGDMVSQWVLVEIPPEPEP